MVNLLFTAPCRHCGRDGFARVAQSGSVLVLNCRSCGIGPIMPCLRIGALDHLHHQRRSGAPPTGRKI